MLRLFQSIFGLESAGRYPDSLVNKAIERTIDGTDPLLRGLSGYQRKLRPAVVNAIDHVVAMIDNLEPPIEVSSLRYDSDPRLKTFFVSSNQMKQVLSSDPDLKAFLDKGYSANKSMTALLVMQKEEKGTFGADRVGDLIMRDVPQVTVSFSNHFFRDPADDFIETCRLLKRRAFDHLLSLALSNITLAEKNGADLSAARNCYNPKWLFLKAEIGALILLENRIPQIVMIFMPSWNRLKRS